MTRLSSTRDSHAASSPTKGRVLRAHLQHPGSMIAPTLESPRKRWPPCPGTPCHPSGLGAKTPERVGPKTSEGVASRTSGKSGSATSERSLSRTTGSPWIYPCRDPTEVGSRSAPPNVPQDRPPAGGRRSGARTRSDPGHRQRGWFGWPGLPDPADQGAQTCQDLHRSQAHRREASPVLGGRVLLCPPARRDIPGRLVIPGEIIKFDASTAPT